MIRTMSLVLAGIAAPAGVYIALDGGADAPMSSSAHMVIPNLSSQAFSGREHFAANCGSCHGAYGEGSDNGPVLIHMIYGETLFRDEEIVASVREGAPARNWPFGDMPAVPGVTDEQLTLMIGFLREVQAANGIE